MKQCKCTFAQKTVGDGCSICNPEFMIELLREQIVELEATIEAQEIIIRDKTTFMEELIAVLNTINQRHNNDLLSL